MAPGDTVRITLDNKLPVDPSCTESGQATDTPHCFNGTNLHSHGLWVSPTGNNDNVLLKLLPNNSFQYEYNIRPIIRRGPSGTIRTSTARQRFRWRAA